MGVRVPVRRDRSLGPGGVGEGGSGWPVTGILVFSGGHRLSPLPGLAFLFPLAGMVVGRGVGVKNSLSGGEYGSRGCSVVDPDWLCCQRCSSRLEVWEPRTAIGLNSVWELQIPLLAGVEGVGALAEFVDHAP